MSQMKYPARDGYKSVEKAKKYASRSPKRNAAELALLSSILKKIPLVDQATSSRLVLDVPTGTGRLAYYMEKVGFKTIKADISYEMLSVPVPDRPLSPAVVADIEGNLPFLDNAFDLVICWRFLHHLPDQSLLNRVFTELARVTKQWIIVSFFHPLSIHNLTRKISQTVLAKPSCRFSYFLRDLRKEGEKVGLKFWSHKAQNPYLKDLWAAVFIKDN